MKIAIDVFGGDNAPSAEIEGCVLALNEYKDISLLLAGDEAKIKAELTKYEYDASRLSILNASDVITTHEQPTVAIKQKPDSSLVKALQAVANKEAECFVSAGSTGAVLTGATLIVRRLKGVKRPALAPLLPTRNGCVMLIDCGANTDCKPEYLRQFAVMGSAYMKTVMGIQNPRVGLINNGAEPEKGNELTKAAYKLLKETAVNFAGNCEARDILSGDFDVLVCDGFDGNIVLKYTEGLASTLMGMIKDELMADMRSKLGALMCKQAFRRLKKRMDYSEYGGALLLGIDGGIIKAHGSSNAKAIMHAIGQGRSLIKGQVVKTIREAISIMPDTED